MPQEPTASPEQVEAFRSKILDKLTYSVGKDPQHAFTLDWFEALALATRDHIVDQWMKDTRRLYQQGNKRVYYLSLEFLIGRLLLDNLSNLGLLDTARAALDQLGVDMEQIRQLEPDAALGNGGLAESIIPAADLSEQISTAGLEASGTSNMKFALNGALTIGTLDGANVEMRDRIGADNMFIFGMTAQQVEARKRTGELSAHESITASPRLQQVLQAIRSGVFSPDDPSRYSELIDNLANHDTFMLCADFEAYWEAQARVNQLWRTPSQWWRTAVLNTARTGWFSSDRTIREYARDIWKVMD